MGYPVWVVTGPNDEQTVYGMDPWCRNGYAVLAILPITRREEAMLMAKDASGRRVHPGAIESGVAFEFGVFEKE